MTDITRRGNDPRITDEIVAKAVIAKGSRAADEGVGHTMRRALEAVIDDLLAHIRPQQCPDCPHRFTNPQK